jgi:hypothetical protein
MTSPSRVKNRSSSGSVLSRLALVLGAVVIGCRSPRPPDLCPTGLKAYPSHDAGIQWGGDSARIEATIASIAVECFQILHPAVRTAQVSRDAYADYQLAATATVKYAVNDTAFFDRITRGGSTIRGTVRFHLETSAGVALEASEEDVQLVRNGTLARVSTKFYSLTDEQIRRITTLRAGWLYSR